MSEDDGEATGDSDSSATRDGSNETETEESPTESTETEGSGVEPPDIDGGAVVFVYDDGRIEDYAEAFPVHETFDAPATVGIVPDWIGNEESNGDEWMHVEHLDELADAGWEIASHTTSHTALGAFDLVEDVAPSDDRVYPVHPYHGYWAAMNEEIEITDGDEMVVRTVVDSGSDDVGRYLQFDDAVGRSFAAGETVERFSESAMDEAVGGSRRYLEDLGFEVDTLVCPYDVCDDYTIEFAKRDYGAVANAYIGAFLNGPDRFDPYDTTREYFAEKGVTRETVEQGLDAVAATEGFGVLAAHTPADAVTPDRIRETLEAIEERDLEVVTMREAVAHFG